MTVLVTGASRGIGRATAIRLAEDHDVAVNYREDADGAAETVAAVEERGAEALAVRADVTDSEAVAGMVEDVVEWDGLDALVNNAGIVRPARATDIDDEDWRAVLETNLSGAFYATRRRFRTCGRPPATSSSSPASAAPPAPSTPATPRARPASTG